MLPTKKNVTSVKLGFQYNVNTKIRKRKKELEKIRPEKAKKKEREKLIYLATGSNKRPNGLGVGMLRCRDIIISTIQTPQPLNQWVEGKVLH
jgi:hypothetical protein